MNEELFGELHEQEEYGLFGKEHERQQCFLHSVGSSVSNSKSKYWKDCPKCRLKMTFGQLVTEEGYCWNCNHRGVF